jgi:MFS family permease
MDIRESLKKFFPESLGSQMREFYASTAIFDFGASLTSIFEPVYLWSAGWSVKNIVILFLVSYIIYFCVAPLGAKFARAYGHENSIALSTPFCILYFIGLYNAPRGIAYAILAAAALALFRTFYWPGARSIISKYSPQGGDGRTVSGLNAISFSAALISPLIGGIILGLFGFMALFIIASIIILLSNIPMLITPEVFEPRSVDYVNSYRRLVRPDFRRTVVGHFGYGEEFISDFIWPIFVVIVIPSYAVMGAAYAVAGVFTLVAIVFIGRITDEHHRHPILRSGTLLTSLSWVLRVFAESPLSVLFAQAFYRVSRLAVTTPLMSIAGEKARAHSNTKSSLIYEMSITVGKILTAAIAVLLLTLFPGNLTPIFILAAGVTFFYAIY